MRFILNIKGFTYQFSRLWMIYSVICRCFIQSFVDFTVTAQPNKNDSCAIN